MNSAQSIVDNNPNQHEIVTNDKNKLVSIEKESHKRTEISPLQIQDIEESLKKSSEHLKTLVISIIVFSLAVTVALIISIFYGPPQVKPTGGVVCDVPLCSKMGVSILKDGGTAFDAIVTTTLCVGLINAQFSGIGGGGFMVIRRHSKDINMAVDFREIAPNNAKKDMFTKNIPEISGLRVAIPSELNGLYEIHHKFGKKNWYDLVMPVVKLAREGFIVTDDLIEIINDSRYHSAVLSRIKSDENLASIYFKNGKLIESGQRISRPKYANILEKIAKTSYSTFINNGNPITDEVIAAVNKRGGSMTKSDINNYKVNIYEPLSTTFLDKKFYFLNSPSGGPAVSLMLNILQEYNLQSINISQALFFHRLIETLKFTISDWRNLGDPLDHEIVNKSVHELFLNKTYAKNIKSRIVDNKTFNADHYSMSETAPSFGTSQISIVSDEEDFISLTTSINYIFGSGITTENDIILNNEMDDFSNPNLHSDKNNYPAPGRRPRSGMSPIILTTDKSICGLRLAIGGVNGSRIFAGVGEVVAYIVGLKMDLNVAINSSRLYPWVTNNFVEYDKPISDDIKNELKKIGHVLILDNRGVTEVNAIGKNDQKTIGFADQRRKGIANIY